MKMNTYQFLLLLKSNSGSKKEFSNLFGIDFLTLKFYLDFYLSIYLLWGYTLLLLLLFFKILIKFTTPDLLALISFWMSSILELWNIWSSSVNIVKFCSFFCSCFCEFFFNYWSFWFRYFIFFFSGRRSWFWVSDVGFAFISVF